MPEKFVANYASPLGNLEIISDQNSILACNFKEKETQSKTIPKILKQALVQLDEYFTGKRKEFNLTLFPSGTEFQEKVWMKLLEIPFGSVISYSELASKIGNIAAVRAVGNANGQNPICIFIPCHRVVGKTGKLVGYGGGLEKKKWLLDF
ncbi:MAG: methylated-DNA--[protein]-cysteine S-methyltransferase, partial [Candidatus Heimdallarchaeota archaeon]|nr:methylated-DNA--[protein]-cysteine S-methyltransferase [Candidatus Heimdallarchaeota archaeon]MCK4611829.1 methylated-DNA--[protein]-cysteine S-methyltransferase [Candidatus Heimdallarchaeota archaeon]